MEFKDAHWKMDGEYIVVWNGNDGYTKVAKAIDGRQSRIIVRTLFFAELIERLLDNKMFNSYLKDTKDLQVPCPEVESEQT
jgi:hypothetical protein